jgi:DNA-binding GntR family transcriptional regulator
MKKTRTAVARSRGRRDISAELAARILRQLADEKLPAGTHIPAQELADRFAVSRSPINQALKLLCAKGIVTHHPNKGYFLSAAVPVSAEEAGLTDDDRLSPIYFGIAEDRLSGRLEDQVSENFLRKTYGVTRSQLSQLLSRISQEGWAARRPGYGWTFSAILTTPEALEQTYRVRMAIEPAALIEPTFQLSRNVAAQCRETEEWFLAGGIETASAHTLYERGVRFHETLSAASRNPFFLDTLRRVNRVRRLLAYRSMIDRRRYYSQAREHLRILDLLVHERNEEAAAMMARHLRSVVRNLKKIKPLLKT